MGRSISVWRVTPSRTCSEQITASNGEKAKLLRSGKDVTLFGTGMMTAFCMEAADLLEKEGIDAEVVHLASIKPIDRELIAGSAARTGCAVSAENASIIGGFGSAVAEVLAETVPVPLARIGVRDRFVNSGGIGDLFRIHGMLPEDIARAAQPGAGARRPGKRMTSCRTNH